MTTSAVALPTAVTSSLPSAISSSTKIPASSSFINFPIQKPCRMSIAGIYRRRRAKFISCAVALKSDSTTSVGDDGSSPSSSPSELSVDSDEEEELKSKAALVGARVRVKVPLKMYHVPRVPEVELTGMEGEIKQFVCLWKGKRISANYPFKVEFHIDVEGRGRVRFFAHLKEEELEFI